ELTITVEVMDSEEDLEKEKLMRIISSLTILIIILNILLVFVFIVVRRMRSEKDQLRTLYYMQKYSKKGRNGRRVGPSDNTKVTKTKPLGAEQKIQIMLNDLAKNDPKDHSYSLDERLTILKYLKRSGKITDDQYKQGLLNLRQRWISKQSVEKNLPDKDEKITETNNSDIT
ncbi:MAG: hypothetical protein JSV49_01245, partial [Thermoplasmata archaeon]